MFHNIQETSIRGWVPYLWFDPNAILDHAARKGAADGETLEHRSNGVTQTESQHLLKCNNINDSYFFLQLTTVKLMNNISTIEKSTS